LCEAGWTACQSCNLSTTAGPLKHRDGCVCAQGMFGNGPKKPKKQTRSQYRRRLVDFYEKYGLADKLDGVDAALDKWKGREEKMFTALNKKYQDVIDAKWEADVKEVKAEEEEIKKAKQEEEAEAAAADAAFGSKQEL